jgi:hypothetical protein
MGWEASRYVWICRFVMWNESRATGLDTSFAKCRNV